MRKVFLRNLRKDLRKVERSKSFYWRDIKDDFIPFLQILSERYVIGYGMIVLESYEPQIAPNQFNKVFSIKDVIDGKIPEYASCTAVNLQINRKINISDIR